MLILRHSVFFDILFLCFMILFGSGFSVLLFLIYILDYIYPELYTFMDIYSIYLFSAIFISLFMLFALTYVTYFRMLNNIKKIVKGRYIPVNSINPVDAQLSKDFSDGLFGSIGTKLSLNLIQLNSKGNASVNNLKDLLIYMGQEIIFLKQNIEILKENKDKEQLHILINQINEIESGIAKLRQILNISIKKDSQDKENIPISEITKNIISTYKDVTIKFEDKSNGSSINIQENHLISLLRSLIDNAVIASDKVYVKLNTSFNNKLLRKVVEITVKDDGEGIPKNCFITERRGRKKQSLIGLIYSNFYTKWNDKQKHFGLGLPLVIAIINAHNGLLYAENGKHKKDPKGASFKVILPLEEDL